MAPTARLTAFSGVMVPWENAYGLSAGAEGHLKSPSAIAISRIYNKSISHPKKNIKTVVEKTLSCSYKR